MLDIVLNNLLKKGSVTLSFHKEENSVKTFKVVFSPNKKPNGNRRIIRKGIFLSLFELQNQNQKIGNMADARMPSSHAICKQIEDFLIRSGKGLKIEPKSISIYGYYPQPAPLLTVSALKNSEGQYLYEAAIRMVMDMMKSFKEEI